VKTVPATVRHQGAALQAADVVATTVEIMVAVIALLVQASPAKALLALTMVLVHRPSAQPKRAVVVHLVAVEVALVAIKVIQAMVVMISSPATFATTPVAMLLALAPITKVNATALAVNLTHCAPV
jgi:hypothetical protein